MRSEKKLAECFYEVFPELNETLSLAKTASDDTVEEWNSLSIVLLIGIVEDKFLIEIPMEQYDKLTSFSGFLEVVESLTK